MLAKVAEHHQVVMGESLRFNAIGKNFPGVQAL